MGRCSSVAAGRWCPQAWWGAVCLAVVLGVSSPRAAAQDFPFDGVVVGGPAQVRAGAGPAYYLVGTLPAGTRVTVREVYYGWNRVDAPEGVFSFISKAMVDAHGDGSQGTVNQDGTKVKAASVDGAGPSYRNQLTMNRGDAVTIVGEDGSYYKITPPDGASVYLSPGTVRRADMAEVATAQPADTAAAVEAARAVAADAAESTTTTTTTVTTTTITASTDTPVTAEDDGEVEIAREVSVEPADVDLTAINPEDMVPAGDAATAEATPEPTPEPQPEPITVVTPEPEPQPEPDPQPAATAVETTSTETIVVEVTRVDPATEPADAAVAVDTTSAETPAEPAAELAAPAVQTPAESDALRVVELAQLPLLDLPVEQQPIGEMVAAYQAVDVSEITPADRELLAFRLAVLEQNRQIAEVLTGVIAARRGTQTTTVVAADDVLSPADYDAVGRLLASAVYNGNNLPLMFRLVEPSTGRTVAYVQPDAVGDTRALLGRVVGILGPMSYDPVLKLNVVAVEEIDALNPTD
ncbi:MAG: hypothetical protein AAGB29_09825 [Planctomycetota bacterium]